MGKNKKPFSFQEFVHGNQFSGVLILLCTVISLLLANVFLKTAYVNWWQTELPLFATIHLPHSVLHFINDGLMAVFFFLAGMEIKREVVSGELSSVQKASLPIVATIGGAAMPIIIFALLNKGTSYAEGWAIPAATDIAFAIGIASLLGNRFPPALKMFLTALAIIDDLIAIIIVAFFYGEAVQLWWLLGCGIVVALLLLINRYKKILTVLHIVLGLVLWYCMFHSGVHATIAGVLFAFFVPMQSLPKVEEKLHGIVNYCIIPLFVIANTAMHIPKGSGLSLDNSLFMGIVAGLFIGKPLGITLCSYFLVKSKMAILPEGVDWKQFIGMGILSGIGFTMSIFISTLAFADSQVIDIAKISVLFASFLSMIVGYLWLRFSVGLNVRG